MQYDLYQVDAFTDRLFSGNPAAVCPLTAFLPDDIMQSIAAENNLSETAFFVKQNDRYHIRWFTPVSEVPLCGHATLASAFVIFNCLEKNIKSITFDSKSGPLYVKKMPDNRIQLDFPAVYPKEIDVLPELVDALGVAPVAMYQVKKDCLVVYEKQNQISAIKPNVNKLLNIDLRAVIVTALAQNECDFVSRVFAPKVGVPEDPVTGAAHCILAPYWAKKLGKTVLKAKQLSQRGGELLCEVNGDRVYLLGQAVLYMKGEIFI